MPERRNEDYGQGLRRHLRVVKLLLSTGVHALVDPDVYAWARKFPWSQDRNGYVQRNVYVDGRRTTRMLAREILGLKIGDRREADHVNRNKLDNRRNNLRITTTAENRHNVSARGPLGLRGVTERDGKFRARVRLKGKYHNLGTFDTAREAFEVAQKFRLENMTHAVS